MSAKFIYSVSDENPDLQKQIGCMNGIFQLFERHHFLSGRRIDQNHKRLPPGQKDNHGNKPKSVSQRPTEKELKKAKKEKQRMSTESSRTSFSSSSCSSSLSSIDCNKQSQPEPYPSGPKHSRGTITRDSPVYQSNDSLQLTRQPVDLRNVVKDSMYREARGIPIKTATKDNAGGQILKYMDSPRPMQQPKSVKSRVSGLNESIQAPWTSNEQKESFPRKDAPRFSCDGRESREAFKSTIKLKEQPRLSLDSRVRSMRGSTTEMKSNYLLGDLQRSNGNSHNNPNQQQEPESYRRPSSVVAKLMGLEGFPNSMSANGDLPSQTKTSRDVESDSLPGTSRTTEGSKQNRVRGSPRNSSKEPISPGRRNADSVKMPIASSKFPMEAAPWKQPDGRKGQTPALKSRDTLTKAPNSSLSVYGEIEKRLAQLEFKKSGKDLRALKQILEAMQKTKEILNSRKEIQGTNFVSRKGNNNSVDQSSELANLKSLKISGYPTSTTTKGNNSPKSFQSSIVIMKGAKSIEKANDSPSSVILAEVLPSLERLRNDESRDSRKESVKKQMSKDPPPRAMHLTDPSGRQLNPVHKNSNAKTSSLAQASKPSTGRSKAGKISEPMNARLQQKKLGLEKQYHSTTTLSDLSRTRRQAIESGSPHRKSRPQSSHLQQNDDQMSDTSGDTRDLSQQGDTISLQSESNISMASHLDTEVTSIDRSDKIHGAFFEQQHGRKYPEATYNEGKSTVEPARVGPEQPSPVSVLDATFYGDEPPSPVNKISHPFKDDEVLNSGEAEWRLTTDLNQTSNCRRSSFSSGNYRKVKNTQYLETNVMHINTGHEISIIDEIAPIYNSTDPSHRYISEILLASGLLRDFESSFMMLQLNPSGHLINPNLFLVLEQSKASTRFLNDEQKGKRVIHSQAAMEKIQRKLVFDAVNEILVHKLALRRSSKEWFSISKLADKGPRRLQLLRDLCSEVDHLQFENSSSGLDDEDDSLRREDLLHGSMDWTGCKSEIPWLVLDVERLIFKDLISEIVRNETGGLGGQHARHCRQLF